MSENFSAWKDANKKPRPKNLDEALSLAISYAILAPSAHNTQPWIFEIKGHEIIISLDENYTIGSSDPNNMLAYMSLGCAKAFLEIALNAMGVDFTTNGLKISALHLDKPKESVDFDAIFNRRSNRFIFSNEKVTEQDVQRLKESISKDNEIFFISDKKIIDNVSQVTANATETAYADEKFRVELANFLRNNLTRQTDGMPGYVVGAPTPLSFLAPTLIRNVNIGAQEKKQVENLFDNVSLVVVATAKNDSVENWIETGRKLAKIILRAQSLGLQAGWFAAPIVIAGDFRNQIKSAIASDNLPQMVLRIGHPSKIQKITPRKPASRVIK